MEQRQYKYDCYKRLPTVVFFSVVLLFTALINFCLIIMIEPLVMEKPWCIVVIVLYVVDILILLAFCIFTILEMLYMEIYLTDTGLVYTDYLHRKREYNYKEILVVFTKSKLEQRVEFIFSKRRALSCVYSQMNNGESFLGAINELLEQDEFLSGEEAEILLVEKKGQQFFDEVVIIAILAITWILTGVVVSSAPYILPF